MTIYKDQLEAVYKLIEKPESWTQHSYARGRRGGEVAPRGKFAVCWCVEGAMLKVLNVTPVSSAGSMVRDELDCLFGTSAAYFNDTHAHAEVLELLRKAIDRAPVRGEP